MRTVLDTALGNAALATLLAVAVAPLARRARPAVAHALWLLVLVKLVTPPVIPLPVPGPWSRPPAVEAEPEPYVEPIPPTIAVRLDESAVAAAPPSQAKAGETKLPTPEQLIG